MKKRLLFVYNPYSGKGKIKNQLSDIVDLFIKEDYEVVIHSTQGHKDATHTTKNFLEKEHFDMIVCSGGDGTFNEIISAVKESGKDVRIGYIPAGTTNDFSYNLDLPKNMLDAARVVMYGEDFLCDIGRFNDIYFTYTAAFGIFTDTSYETPQTTKNVLGRLAYILEGIKRLPNWKSYTLEISHDGETITDTFIYGMVANSESIGGIKGLTGKDVILDDGLFEGIFIKAPQNVLDFQKIINDLLTGNLHGESIYFFTVTDIHISSEELIPWSIDGEFGGELLDVHIQVHKQGIRIVRNTEELMEVL